MKFVVDDQGVSRAVVQDLSERGELWEDLCDSMIARDRGDEPTIAWDDLKGDLLAEPRLS